MNERRTALAKVALDVPDVSKIDLDKLSPAELATLSYALSAQLAAVNNRVQEWAAPVQQLIVEARKRITEKIHEDGGKALPHDTFKVLLSSSQGKRSNENARYVGGLFELIELVPADELAPCLWIEHVEVDRVDPAAISAICQAGGRAKWKCNITKLDVLARQYGGKIAEIIAAATPRGPDGAEILTITPKESAMKKVGHS